MLHQNIALVTASIGFGKTKRLGFVWAVVISAALLPLAFQSLPAAAHVAPTGWSYPSSCCNGDRKMGDCQSSRPSG